MTPDEAGCDAAGAAACGRMRDEVSAWIDGQCDDAGRVEAHLADCPACAEYARGLQAVSGAIKSLPAARVDDAFALKVAARIRRRNARRYWPAASGLLAAVASLVIAAAVLLSLGEPATSLSLTAETEPGEAGLVGDILLGAEASPWDYGFPVAPEAPDEGADDLVLALADSGWFQEAAEAWEADVELDDLVLSLDEAEKLEFEQLLRTYEEGAGI